MLERRTQRQKPTLLLAHSKLGTDSAGGRACDMLLDEFDLRNIDVVTASHGEDARAILGSNAAIPALLLDWSVPGPGGKAADHRHHFLPGLEAAVRIGLHYACAFDATDLGNLAPDPFAEIDLGMVETERPHFDQDMT